MCCAAPGGPHGGRSIGALSGGDNRKTRDFGLPKPILARLEKGVLGVIGSSG